MAVCYIVSFIVFLLINDCVQSATWSASSLQDGQQLYACAGDNVTLTWSYMMNTGEELGDVRWWYNGHSQELVAILTQGTFFPTPSFSQRVTMVDNAGLTISKVLVADSGNYSVSADVYSKDGALHTLLHRSATVQVSEHLLTTDGALHVVQNPDPVYNNATGQWVIQLQCGNFIHQSNPPFNVEWTTPSGHVHNSTSFSQGKFYFHIPMPVETGNYVCGIPEHLTASACLHGNGQNRVAVRVESVEARLVLLEKENWDLKHKLTAAQAEVTQQQSTISQLQAINSQQQVINSQQEAINNRQESINSQQQAISSQLQMNISALNSKTSNISQQLHQIEDVERNRVAFHATGLYPSRVDANTSLVFNGVVYNQGNAYNSSTGYFTAPYSGLYFFIAKTSEIEIGGYELHYLMVDENIIDEAFTSFPTGSPGPDPSPVYGVVHLTEGQRVYVMCPLNEQLWSALSAFSGFLLSRDS